ncbi:MAG: deoxyribose-phosphate aldolase [Acidobacteria bacterium]|nr:deoxyribose-phosphate aldolase [Acidobacteriota bacterium]
MDPNSNFQQEERPPLVTYEDVAGRLELSLTRPDLDEEEVDAACRKALAYGIGAVVVRPSDVDMAVRILGGTPVAVASVAGFPHGSSNTATKLYEGRDLLRRGVKEVSLVVNFGKMRARQFQHVETEILQMSESCHQSEAILKVIFETAYLAEDLKIILCKICKRTDTDFAETDTGFSPGGYTVADLTLLKTICKDAVKIKASGAIGTLERFNEAYSAGCERFGSTDVFAVADEWKKVLAEREAAAKQAAGITS